MTTGIDLYEKYGYCTISKGAVLYRGVKPEVYGTDQMFFGTKYYEAAAYGDKVQIWIAKKPIQILFLAKKIDSDAKVDTSLVDLYYHLHPNEPQKDLRDLDIKQDIRRRDPFARKLFSDHGVNGWFTSTENGSTPYEVCLFNLTKLKSDLDLLATVEDEGKKYFHELIRKMKFFPTEEFYQNSRNEISSRANGYYYGRKPENVHKNAVKAWIKDEVERGMEPEAAKHYYYDLRLKLKL